MKKRYKIMLWLSVLIILITFIVNVPFLTLTFKTNLITKMVVDAPGHAPKGTYPLLLLHGFNPMYSRRLSEFSLYDLQNSLAKDLNYIDKEMFIQDMTCVQLQYAEKPIIIRATYFSKYDVVEIEEYTRNLKKIIDRVLYCTGAEKVDIISHSMGGIVVRSYMQEYNQSNVRKLIMLGTPNQGGLYNLGKTAEYFIDEGSSKIALDFIQLSENHAFMQNLSREPLEGIQIYTVAGNSDGQGDGLILADSVPLNNTLSKHKGVPCNHIALKHPNLCPEMYDFVKEALTE